VAQEKGQTKASGGKGEPKSHLLRLESETTIGKGERSTGRRSDDPERQPKKISRDMKPGHQGVKTNQPEIGRSQRGSPRGRWKQGNTEANKNGEKSTGGMRAEINLPKQENYPQNTKPTYVVKKVIKEKKKPNEPVRKRGGRRMLGSKMIRGKGLRGRNESFIGEEGVWTVERRA